MLIKRSLAFVLLSWVCSSVSCYYSAYYSTIDWQILQTESLDDLSQLYDSGPNYLVISDCIYNHRHTCGLCGKDITSLQSIVLGIVTGLLCN